MNCIYKRRDIVPIAYFGTFNYTVTPRNTLFKIAKDYKTTIDNILKFNNIANMLIIKLHL